MMMKQIAFAAASLATISNAMIPSLILSNNDTQDYFLGLEKGNPAVLKMPRDHRARDGACFGWRL